MTTEAIIAKNSLADDGLWITPITLQKDTDIYRLINNTEDVVWNGDTYTAIGINIGDIKDSSKGELPSLQIEIDNTDRMIQSIIEADPDFGSGWDVKISFVYIPAPIPSPLDITLPSEIDLNFQTTGCSCDYKSCTFEIGIKNPILATFPKRRMIPNKCQATFKVEETGCPYIGADETCEYTLSDCKTKFAGQDIPFVGFPGIPTGRGVFII